MAETEADGSERPGMAAPGTGTMTTTPSPGASRTGTRSRAAAVAAVAATVAEEAGAAARENMFPGETPGCLPQLAPNPRWPPSSPAA